MARFWLILVLFSLVYPRSLVTGRSIKSIRDLSPRQSFLKKLNEFVSYVEQGFQSIRTSIKDLKQDLAAHRNIIANLNLKDLSSSVQILKSLEPVCQDGWTKHAGRCFKFVNCTKSCSANQAMDLCLADRAELASCLSRDQQEFFIRSIGKTAYIFLGGNNKNKKGIWSWADGTPIKNGFANWQKGEPDSGTRVNCLVLKVPSKKWYDVGCDYMHKSPALVSFVCERPLTYHTSATQQ